MPEPAGPRYGSIRAPLHPSVNGSAKPPQPPPARRRPRRIASIRMGLIAGIGVLILLVVFLAQNASAVHVTFFGAHASVPLAFALLAAAVAGAVVMAALGTARITRLRRTMRRTRRSTGDQAQVPASDTQPERDTGG